MILNGSSAADGSPIPITFYGSSQKYQLPCGVFTRISAEYPNEKSPINMGAPQMYLQIMWCNLHNIYIHYYSINEKRNTLFNSSAMLTINLCFYANSTVANMFYYFKPLSLLSLHICDHKEVFYACSLFIVIFFGERAILLISLVNLFFL